MNQLIQGQTPALSLPGRLTAAAGLVLLAILAVYRAWVDIATIAIQDPEQSQVLLALPAAALLLYTRREHLASIPLRSSLFGVATAALGWALSWYGYMQAIQSVWHLGALIMVVGAVWSVLGGRAMLVALPGIVALLALIPVPNLIRQDIALPLQRLTASGAEVVLVAFGFSVERLGQTLFYKDKPVTIEEACNGMRMVFALALVCYSFVMACRLNGFARVALLALSPLLAVACNIVRVVPTVVIYGELGDASGDLFHDLSGWAMIFLAALMLVGVVRLLRWADIPIDAQGFPVIAKRMQNGQTRRALPWIAAPAACAVVMGGAVAHSYSLPTAQDAQPYHAAVATAAEQTPIQVAGLAAQPQELPDGSVSLLRPNTARAVQYTDESTGAVAQFLLIQSRDARDLAGHYPPRCYPNVYGYELISTEPRQWQVQDRTINGTAYTFAENPSPQAPRWVVLHSFVLPAGKTTGKLEQMRAAAADYLRRHHGAAQVQLLFREQGTTAQVRDAVFERVLNGQAKLINAILSDPDHPSNSSHPTTSDNDE